MKLKAGKIILILALLTMVVYSAMQVVSVRYEYRRAFSENDAEQTYQLKLLAEIHSLQAQKRTYLEPAKLDAMARGKLNMKPAGERLQSVDIPAAKIAKILQTEALSHE